MIKYINLSIWKNLVKSSVSSTINGDDSYGFVTYYSSQGPTELTWAESGYSKVEVWLENASGDSVLVNLRGQRKTACSVRTMNSAVLCGSSDKYSQLILSFYPEDNEDLVYKNVGSYIGVIPLQARQYESQDTDTKDIVAVVTLRDLVKDSAPENLN